MEQGTDTAESGSRRLQYPSEIWVDFGLFDVIAHLQRAEGMRFEVSLKRRARVRAA